MSKKDNDLNIIQNSIRTYYRDRYHWPLLYLAVLLVLVFFLPIFSLLAPSAMSSKSDLAVFKKHNRVYGEYQLPTVYFTGYTSSWMGQTRGYYYYTSINDQIVILLLDPKTCEQGNPIINDVTFHGKLMKRGKAVDLMLSYLADDLDWTIEGINDTVSPYLISEPDATGLSTLVFKIIYCGSFIFTVLAILCHTVFFLFPRVSPTILTLHRFGNPYKILDEAEEELSTVLQLQSESIYITLNYFIKLDDSGVAIVPIKYIIWVYESPQSRHFLWHNYDITYTLHVVAAKHHEIRCSSNKKKATLEIIDYLTEANHRIITEYKEESRLKAEHIQNERDKRAIKKILRTLHLLK